jgi:hypothetical protein
MGFASGSAAAKVTSNSVPLDVGLSMYWINDRGIYMAVTLGSDN